MESDPIEDSPQRHNPMPPRPQPRVYSSDHDSDDELFEDFNPNQAGDTVATIPLDRPFNPTARTPQAAAHVTQPTQPWAAPTHNGAMLSQILVPSSTSPPPPPPQPAKRMLPPPGTGFQPPGTTFQPPGTMFRPPYMRPAYTPQSQSQTQFSDYNDIPMDGSDSDGEDNGDIPPSFGRARPQHAQNGFKKVVNEFAYSPHTAGTANPMKRPAVGDIGSVARPLKQQRASQPQSQVVVLSDDDDAEGETDSEMEIVPKPTANRNFQAQKTGLSEYSRIAQKPKLAPAPPSSSQPAATPPSKPLSRLQKGIRPDHSRESSAPRNVPKNHHRRVIDEDEESEAEESGAEEEDALLIEDDSADVDEKVFGFLKECSEKDLVSVIDCKPEDAEFLLSKRPFKSLDAIRRISRPTTGKRRGGSQRPLGEMIVDKVSTTEEAFMAVDRVVNTCQTYSKDVQSELKNLGINTSIQSAKDGLNVASLDNVDAKITQPSTMSKDRTLKDYQVVGLNWLAIMYKLRIKWQQSNGCILADEMGLGKTYQVISFLTHLYETGEQGRHLVIVPSSTLENWLREFKNFSPELGVEPYYGKASQREEQQLAIEDAGDSVNVIVTTYNIAAGEKDNHWLRKMKFMTCVFDEGHKLKNSNSKGYRALRRIKAQFRLFLTGTPLQNNLQELVSVLAFIMPKLFEDDGEDLEKIFACKAKTTDSEHAALLASQRTDRAKEMLKPFILRRTKDQVLKDLPPKTSRVVECEMTARQKETYNYFSEIHDQILADRAAGKKMEESGKFPHLQDRRSTAIHPLLRRMIYDDDAIRKMLPKIPRKGKPWSGKSDEAVFEEMSWFSDWEIHNSIEKYHIKKPAPLKNKEWMDSGKVNVLIKLLKEHKEQGSRTLIFSQYAKVLDILETVLETEGVSNLRLDGTTPTEDRQKLIDLFNDNPDIQTFIITTRSGGAGINLASADRVIIFDPSFNPQDDVQAANRAHRIGQTKPVEVVTLVSKGTIEEAIYKLGLSKLALDARVAGAGDDPEAGGEKIEKANMKRLEEMLMKGATTPADGSLAPTKVNTPAEGTPAPGTPAASDVQTEEPKAKEETKAKAEPKIKLRLKVKEKVKEEEADEKPEKKGKKTPKGKKAKKEDSGGDIRDAFQAAMESKGVAFAKA